MKEKTTDVAVATVLKDWYDLVYPRSNIFLTTQKQVHNYFYIDAFSPGIEPVQKHIFQGKKKYFQIININKDLNPLFLLIK